MPKAVLLNAARLDFDNRLDVSALSAVAELSRFDESTPEEIVARVAGQQIVITKELPVPRELIARFSDSVRLICEAGTGYNNIDLAAARKKGIAVCNAPAYSTEAVAQLEGGMGTGPEFTPKNNQLQTYFSMNDFIGGGRNAKASSHRIVKSNLPCHKPR